MKVLEKIRIMLLDIEIEDIEVPSIDYHLELEISTKVLSNMINSVIATVRKKLHSILKISN